MKRIFFIFLILIGLIVLYVLLGAYRSESNVLDYFYSVIRLSPRTSRSDGEVLQTTPGVTGTSPGASNGSYTVPGTISPGQFPGTTGTTPGVTGTSPGSLNGSSNTPGLSIGPGQSTTTQGTPGASVVVAVSDSAYERMKLRWNYHPVGNYVGTSSDDISIAYYRDQDLFTVEIRCETAEKECQRQAETELSMSTGVALADLCKLNISLVWKNQLTGYDFEPHALLSCH